MNSMANNETTPTACSNDHDQDTSAAEAEESAASTSSPWVGPHGDDMSLISLLSRRSLSLPARMDPPFMPSDSSSGLSHQSTLEILEEALALVDEDDDEMHHSNGSSTAASVRGNHHSRTIRTKRGGARARRFHPWPQQ